MALTVVAVAALFFSSPPPPSPPRGVTAAPAVAPWGSTYAERQRYALQQHIDKPWPKINPSAPAADNAWANANLRLAQLALLGPSNATLAAEVSADVATWSSIYQPFHNYTVQGPLSGLGELPVLVRLALSPLTRPLLSSAALASLNEIFFEWVSPRSKVVWAAANDSWLWTDGSENLDATRKGTIYLALIALNSSAKYRHTNLEIDGQSVADHAAAWQSHWQRYFTNRAVEGIGVELGSPTYGKYSLQNFINIADLDQNGLGKLASDFLQLWFADAAQAFLPDVGVRGGAHNRVYRDSSFFNPVADGLRGITWLFGWWQSTDINVVDYAISLPQITLFATSLWRPLPVINAIAKMDSSTLTDSFIYASRRLGDVLPCEQSIGPVNPQGTKCQPQTCKKTPCKPCVVCRGALAWSACDSLNTPTTVVKQEYVAAGRSYTLGAIQLDQRPTTLYGADVGQNHQIGAFFGGQNQPRTRLVFGDSGSVNCSSSAFQRHAFSSLTSRLVSGAVAVARPIKAKINGCPPPCPPHLTNQSLDSAPCTRDHCADTDFPLFAFVSSDLYSTRTTAGDWDCFNGANETFACLALTRGHRLLSVPCMGENSDPESSVYWDGMLLLFNGSRTTRSIGVLQMGSRAEHVSFDNFVKVMQSRKMAAFTEPDGSLKYTSLAGEELKLGVGAATQSDNLDYTYASPYILGKYEAHMKVTLSAPGHSNVTLEFDARS